MAFYKWGFNMIGMNAVDSLSWGPHGPDVVILREEEDAMPPEFYFSSQHLNDLKDESEVCARAMQLKILFDGALLLQHGYGYRPEKMHELWAMDRYSRRGLPEPASGISTFSPAHCRQPLNRMERGAIEKSLVDASLYIARSDQVVHDVLQSFGVHGITWSSLYALTDTMTTNGFDEEAQWLAARSTKSEYKRFKHTANSASVLGPMARHGQTRHAPPPQPMDLDRAAEIVLDAARAFVRRRIIRGVAWLSLSGDPAASVTPATPLVTDESMAVALQQADDGVAAQSDPIIRRWAWRFGGSKVGAVAMIATAAVLACWHLRRPRP